MTAQYVYAVQGSAWVRDCMVAVVYHKAEDYLTNIHDSLKSLFALKTITRVC